MRRAAIAILLLAGCASVDTQPQPQRIRMEQRELPGTRLTVDAGLGKPVELLVTPAAQARGSCDLLVHFHGATWLPMQAAGNRPLCVAAIHLGAGSSVYERPMREPRAFETMLAAIRASSPPVRRVYLSSFSAGYGAIRAILDQHAQEISGVMLLDGLHTGYTPEGNLESGKMEPFRRLAREAAAGRKRFVVTHSEIVPPDYPGTSETADDLIRAAGATRVRREGLRFGMLQRSESACGGLTILGFRGDEAPDHIDHFHAMPQVLAMLLDAI